MATYTIKTNDREFTVEVRRSGSQIIVEHSGKEYSVEHVKEYPTPQSPAVATATPSQQRLISSSNHDTSRSTPASNEEYGEKW